jgi:hypothetical protein
MALRVKKNAAWKHLFDFDIKNKVYASQQKTMLQNEIVHEISCK